MIQTNDKQSFVTVTQGLRGWFAVEMWWNPEMGGFWEPWTSSPDSYPTREGAVDHAKVWAEDADIPYRETLP